MLSLVEAMTGPVIRSWHLRLPDPARGRREEVHKVQLRHFPLTGHRTITVDGIEVHGVEAEGQYDGGGSKGGGVTVKVRVGSHDCWVGFRAANRLGRYYYSCIVDGVVMPELNETVGDGGDDDGETIPLPGEVSVDSVGTAKDSVGTEFLEFRVVTRRGGRRRQSGGGGGGGGNGVARKEGGAGDRTSGSGRRSSGSVGSGSGGDDGGAHYAVVWRRFSAFRSLHNDVTSLLWGSHLLGCLPPLPAKCINPLINQTGPAFVEKRRGVLQAYLRRMLEVPKARASVNLMGFLGLHPVTGSPLPWAASSPSAPRRLGPNIADEQRWS